MTLSKASQEEDRMSEPGNLEDAALFDRAIPYVRDSMFA
jgi:hypothetical protein